MIGASPRVALWALAIVVAAAVGSAGARGGRGGGGRGAAGRGGAGGFNGRGMAAGGSFGQGRPAGGGGFSAQGAAASGSIGGGQPSGGLGGGGTAGGGQVDREALAQRQNERFGRLGPPDAGRQEQRQEQRAAAREDHQAYATNRREDWLVDRLAGHGGTGKSTDVPALPSCAPQSEPDYCAASTR